LCCCANSYNLVETAGRHLEDLDYLFANDSPFVWNAEREFAAIKSAEAAADSKVIVEGEGEESG
jgi:hypothetical protein